MKFNKIILGLFVLTFFLIFTPNIARASSTPDIPITSELKIDYIDYTLDWSQVCTDESSNLYYKKRPYYTDDTNSVHYEYTNKFCNTFKDHILNNYDYGYYVAFLPSYNAYSITIYPKNTTFKISFNNFYGYYEIKKEDVNFDDVMTVEVMPLNNNNNTHTILNYMYGNNDVNSDILNSSFGAEIFLLANTPNVIWPSDYSGPKPPSEIKDKPQMRPDFEYSVNNKDISAKDKNVKLPSYTPDDSERYFKNYSIMWHLFKCNGGYTELTKTCEDSDLIDTQDLPQNDRYNFKVNDLGIYSLEANYRALECYRYPSYPSTPDYCYYITLNDTLNEFDWTMTRVFLDVNGSSFTGDTKDLECDLNGNCELVNNYEQCDSLDLACHLNNFWKRLTAFFNWLFVPDSSLMTKTMHELSNNIKYSNSIFFAPVNFIYNVFNTASNVSSYNNNNCSIDVPFNGNVGKLELCSWRHATPQLFSFLQNLLRALLAILFFVFIWRKTGEILGFSSFDFDDDDDTPDDGPYSSKGDGFGSRRAYIKDSKK